MKDFLLIILKVLGAIIIVYVIGRILAVGFIHEFDNYLYKKFKSYTKTKEDGKKEN
jgi:uncharacterized protein YxeA